MFTVRLVQYAENVAGQPTATAGYSIREAKTVHVRYEPDMRAVLQLGDAPGETDEFTIGSAPNCAYNVAYVMNERGKTVDTIR
jgi:hypothetical protein